MSLRTLSRGTTIVSVPFKEGVLLATDTRATDTNTFNEYYCHRKVDPFYLKVEPQVEIWIAGAGASSGTQIVAEPAMKVLRESLKLYNIKLNHIKDPIHLLDFYNQIMAKHFIPKLTGIQSQLIDVSRWILVFKNQHFVVSFETSFTGGDCFYCNLVGRTPYSSLGGIGSGSRYILGAICAENELNPFESRPEKEVRQWLLKNFKSAISRDLGSSTNHGMYLLTLNLKNPTKTETFY